MRMKYNFVIFATVFDWYQFMYRDITSRKDVAYYKDFADLQSPMERILYKIHLSKKINKIVCLPHKTIWYKRALRRIHFENDKPVCFIWYSHFFKEIDYGMPEYIKQTWPGAKNVYYYTDQKNMSVQHIERLRGKMDLIGVFDPTVAEQYQIHFWPNVYPDIEEKQTEIEYDVCFIGKDKGRQAMLEEIARVCEDKGLRTAFYLLGAEGPKSCKAIHYIKKLIPYEEALDIVRKSKCVLELKMGEFDSCSVRVEEAVLLGKKILTNNTNVNKMPCCQNAEAVQYFEKVPDIDWDFIKADKEVSYDYHGEYSAGHFLEEIERALENV